jgi:hypothetical protein
MVAWRATRAADAQPSDTLDRTRTGDVAIVFDSDLGYLHTKHTNTVEFFKSPFVFELETIAESATPLATPVPNTSTICSMNCSPRPVQPWSAWWGCTTACASVLANASVSTTQTRWCCCERPPAPVSPTSEVWRLGDWYDRHIFIGWCQ